MRLDRKKDEKKKEPIKALDLLRAIVKGEELQGAERSVLIPLIVFSGPRDGWSAFPSHARLARGSQLNPSTIKSALKKLRERGFVTWQTRAGTSNFYTIHARFIYDRACAANAKRRNEESNHVLRAEATKKMWDECDTDNDNANKDNMDKGNIEEDYAEELPSAKLSSESITAPRIASMPVRGMYPISHPTS